MATIQDDELIDGLREAISRKGLKLPFLAKELGVSYRSLQNYLYKSSRMPIWVYLGLCERVGLTPDYLTEGRFRLAHHSLVSGVETALNPILNQLDVRDDLKVVVVPERELTHARRRAILHVIAHAISSRYDIDRELNLWRPSEADEGEA